MYDTFWLLFEDVADYKLHPNLNDKMLKKRDSYQWFISGIRILDFDIHAALHFGDILADMKQGKILQENSDRDKMIAAHARSLGYALVTNNTKDFIHIKNLCLEDWRTPGDLQGSK